jgi:hypothetical protein
MKIKPFRKKDVKSKKEKLYILFLRFTLVLINILHGVDTVKSIDKIFEELILEVPKYKKKSTADKLRSIIDISLSIGKAGINVQSLVTQVISVYKDVYKGVDTKNLEQKNLDLFSNYILNKTINHILDVAARQKIKN